MKILPVQYNKQNFQSKHTKQNRTINTASERCISPYFVSPYIYKVENPLENYDSAQKIFRNNLENGKGIFGTPDNVDKLIQNDKIRRNVVKFFAEYSKSELNKLNSKKILTMDDIEKGKALVEVRDFFSEYEESWNQNDYYFKSGNNFYTGEVAFAGNMNAKQEKYCKNIVHGYSAACGAVSAALGEGAAIGADTVPLRVLQFAMFSTMAGYLNVPAIPSFEYYTKEMFAGATLGVGGAKLITSWLGIGGHAASVATGTSAATGGGTDAAITGGVRAVNSVLSTLITEKMGRGYINRVKANRMTFKDQTIETGAYFLGRGALTRGDSILDMMNVDFKDPSCPELIKNALDSIPSGSQEAISTALELAKEFSYRAGAMFTINYIADLFANKETDPKKRKERAKAIFRQSLINACVYQICDVTVENTITKEAAETIKDIQENLDKYPEVYHEIINAEHEFFEQVNIDTLSADAFTDQFKNKTFVHNLSRFCNSMVNEVSIAIVNRKRAKHIEQIKAANEGIAAENQKTKQTQNKLSKEEQEQVQKQLEELQAIFNTQRDYYKKQNGFGYGRIAGYENTKEDLTQKFILPLSLNESGFDAKIPGAILFYGPTGVGKSEFVRALAEQGKCLIPRFKDPDDTDELKEELASIKQKSKEQKRHTALIIDEFDDYGSNIEAAKIFADFIKDCADNNITLLLTTNNPLDIDRSILDETINIPIAPPDKKDITAVLKFYLPDLKEEEYEEIAGGISEKSKNGAYSNSQIKYICSKLKGSSKPKETMLQLIQNVPCDIHKKDMDKFNKEIKELEGNK